MASLRSLPVELLEAIAHNLSARDLGVFRNLSHRFHTILTPLFQSEFFTSRVVPLKTDSLITLRQILESELGSHFEHLTIQGGLIDASEIQHEYYNLRYESRGSLGHRILLILSQRVRPQFITHLAEAFDQLPNRQLQSLTIKAPTARSLTFSTEEVRQAICWKSLVITLEALTRGHVAMRSLKVLGFTCPIAYTDDLNSRVKHAFTDTTNLELDFAATATPNRVRWLAAFLRCFTNLKQVALYVAQHSSDTFLDIMQNGLTDDLLQKLVLGRGQSGYDLMVGYLEARGLKQQAIQLKCNFENATDAFMQNQVWAKLESIELDNMSELTAHYTHGECCTISIGMQDFQQDLETFHKHVEEAGPLSGASLD